MRQLVSEALDRIEQVSSRRRRRREADQRIHEASVGALVSDLVHGMLFSPRQRIAVPLSKGALARTKRQVPFMTEKFADTVRAVSHERVGVADLEVGYKTALGSRRSTLFAGPWLSSRVEELEVEIGDIGRDHMLLGDPLILNSRKVGGKKHRLALPDTPLVRELQREMDEINGWLAGADIEYLFCPVSDGVDTGQRYLRRVFNNGSLDLGGRLFHGFWQGMSEEKRLTGILVGGEPVVSLDFAQMALHLAYGEVRAPVPEGDLYAIPGYAAHRTGLKKVINALLASDGLPSRMPRGTRAHFPATVKFSHVYQAICAHHSPLAPLFGTASALRFMNTESRVIVRALLELKAKRVVALPIHDCLLVGRGHEGLAKEVLEQSFRAIAGAEGRVEVERSSLEARVVVEKSYLEGMSRLPLKRGA
ncbi:hypothetical protein E5843_02830 [Luteimonas yindakuii]|nr:hypothetical protein E5843_02830 [Luteimonas yindakuii]